MEMGVWLDHGGVESTAALGDHGVEVIEGGEVAVGDRLVAHSDEVGR